MPENERNMFGLPQFPPGAIRGGIPDLTSQSALEESALRDYGTRVANRKGGKLIDMNNGFMRDYAERLSVFHPEFASQEVPENAV